MPTILLKKSDTPSAVPTTANLTNLAGGAEVAVNTADKRLFTMNSSSAVVELGTNPSSLSIANNASINILTATTATITTLNATSATVTTLGSTSANVTTLTGTSATITNIFDGVGKIRAIPSAGTAKTTAYTLAVTDVGEYVEVGASGSITVPNDIFATGDVVAVFNNTTGNISINCPVTTAYIAGTDADKASVTLSTRGVASVLFINPSLCVITGNVS
jgi:hypothetical protein